MAGKKENIKALFSNTRTRVIILFTIILLCSTVVIGFLKFGAADKKALPSGANIKQVSPGIRSIPGALDPTVQYASLQEKQNINQAETATKKGGSSIPTLIKTQRFGEGVDLIGTKPGEGSLGFIALSNDNMGGQQKGLWIQELKADNCSLSAIKKTLDKGAAISVIHEACSCAKLKEYGYTLSDLVTTCLCPELKAMAFTASELKAAGYTAEKLKRCGFSACQTRSAKFTAEAMSKGGFSNGELKGAGFSDAEIVEAGGVVSDELSAAGCDVEALKVLRAKGVSAAEIRRTNGCSLAALKAAGFTAAELRAAGFSAAELKAAGFSEAELKAAGFSDEELKAAGFSILDVEPEKITGSSRGVSSVTRLPSLKTTRDNKRDGVTSETKQLQALMARQKGSMSEQRYKEKVKQKKGRMLSAANEAVQGWKKVSTQVFIEGSAKDDELADTGASLAKGLAPGNPNEADMNQLSQASVFIKTGDILFAVLDTSVNTDEPGPILATIVSGTLKGSKIIGSFTLPTNANKMVLTFNTLSVLGSDKTISISSYAIDPNTARTALAGRVNHHYLMRYGSLFASTFLAGFSSAIQSADTTITIGGTGGTTDTTVQNGINRSLLENTLIGLGEVGKAWAETAQQLMNRPTTVELYSGTGMGILFTQDVQLA